MLNGSVRISKAFLDKHSETAKILRVIFVRCAGNVNDVMPIDVLKIEFPVGVFYYELLRIFFLKIRAILITVESSSERNNLRIYNHPWIDCFFRLKLIGPY